MILLGVETSCDETGASVIHSDSKINKLTILSNTVATSLAVHSKTGGVIPENAAREQLKVIIPVIKKSLRDANVNLIDIDTLALTYGPGLIGSLLVGVETVKTLSMILEKPIVPVNHMIGHVYANWIENANIMLPAMALVVSGGHTDLLFIKKHGDYKLIGGTRDDAAGEAFDKIGRLLGLAYPAGPRIEQLAEKGDSNYFHFPRPLLYDRSYDFSFSGLKTAAYRHTLENPQPSTKTIANISRCVQDAIIEVLVKKTLRAANELKVKSIILSGGVAANDALRKEFAKKMKENNMVSKLYFPDKNLCTDNAAMIAAAAYYNPNAVSWEKVQADPQLYFA